MIESALDALLDEFYDHVLKQPELRRIFPDEASIRHARERQRSHWLDVLFSGDLSEERLAEMRRVGETHLRVGLTPQLYLSSYCFMLNRFVDCIVRQGPRNHAALSQALQALNKAVYLDATTVIQSYMVARNAALKAILVRATHFTEDVKQLLLEMREAMGELSEGIGETPGAHDAVARVEGSLAKMRERMDQLMYGDRLYAYDEQPEDLLSRVERFLDRHT